MVPAIAILFSAGVAKVGSMRGRDDSFAGAARLEPGDPPQSDVPAPWLSVVIPAYNEESRLPASLKLATAYLRQLGQTFELLVVDDGSTDSTREVAMAAGPEVRALALPHAGKGAALRAGVLASRGQFVLCTDADLSAPITELPALLSSLQGGAAVAIGSRALRSSRVQVAQPLHRRMMGRGFNLLVQMVLLPGLHDTQCGFKLFRGDIARQAFRYLEIDGFACDVETLFLVRLLGHRVEEVAVEWNDAPGSRVRAVRDSTDMFFELMNIRWRCRRLARGVRARESAISEPARP
jgi:dolichyl-phosphate beta-glucosyltransferase